MVLRLVVEGERVRAAGFEGEGCAISQAAASALVDVLPSWELREVAARTRFYEQRLGLGEAEAPAGGEDVAALGDLAAFEGVRAFPTRRRCALLPLRALAQALAGDAG